MSEALDSLYAQHGELRARIADDGGGLRRFVNVYLGGEDIRFLEGPRRRSPARRAHDPAGSRGRRLGTTASRRADRIEIERHAAQTNSDASMLSLTDRS